MLLFDSRIEVALLDHQLQQYKLLTLVACVYALLSTEDFMDKLYLKGVDQIAKGNFDLLPEVSCITAHLLFIIMYQQVHATSCGLKALFSDLICQGIEVSGTAIVDKFLCCCRHVGWLVEVMATHSLVDWLQCMLTLPPCSTLRVTM